MTTIVQDLTARLNGLAELLQPEEREKPSKGRKPDEPGGLVVYLAARPAGVIQLETPQPITSDGLLDTLWVPVGCMGSTAQIAAGLALGVRQALCGDPREPGIYTLTLPDQPRQIIPGAWLCRPTFALNLLAGQIPA